jgi:hypothetical protein
LNKINKIYLEYIIYILTMDAETAARKAAEAALKRSFYPPHTTAVSTIHKQKDDADEDVLAHIKERNKQWKIEEAARIAAIEQVNAAIEPQNANAAIEPQNANAEEAEDARIARIAKEREDARIAIIAAKIKAEEDEKTKNWWGARLDWTGIPLGNQGGGRNGKKKSKRMIKMKNAKNKSKSKSQSRRQRQKRRRHSRRV